MVCSCRFIDIKCTILAWDVDNGQVMHAGGRSIGEISISSPWFCCELKIMLKNKVLVKNI